MKAVDEIAKTCLVCKKAPARQGGMICDECLLGNDPPVFVVPKPVYLCSQCGEKYEEYRHGAVVPKKTCKKCIVKSSKRHLHLTGLKYQDAFDGMLLIDFHKDLDLLERIKSISDAEMRTPENQVLYWLHKHLAGRKPA